jgi:hypothetical protein
MEDNLLLNLRILANLPENCKIMRVPKNTYYNSIKRSVTHDQNRDTMTKDIAYIVSSAYDRCCNIINSKVFECKLLVKDPSENYGFEKMVDEYEKQIQNLKRLHSQLSIIPRSITNLKNVYKNDEITVAKLDIILVKLYCVIDKTNKKLKSYDPNLFLKKD